MTEKPVIFTDLDGTLLDYDTYSSELVMPLVTRLKQAAVPIVFCSSKTRAEQEVYRRQLGIDSPFVVEDGGAIFIKSGYFPFSYDYHRLVDDYQVIEMDMSYGDIRRILEQIRQRSGLDFRGFGDMDAAEVARLTGLSLASAELARRREYEETLPLTGPEPETELILNEIEKAGLSWSQGTRFYGINGGSDKGQAVRVLIGLFGRKLGRIKTVGIGDSPNDAPMLAVVDVPVLVQKPGGRWANIELANIYRADGAGPRGWVKAVTALTGL